MVKVKQWGDAALCRKIPRLVRKLGLDRRKVYTVGYFNELATCAKATELHEYCDHQGCDACGHTGKRVLHWPDSVVRNGLHIQLAPMPPMHGPSDFPEEFRV